jgi:hypothetical protein
MGNVGLLSRNTSGYRGVTWDKQTGKWRAFGKRGGRGISLGRFASIEEAAAAAEKWRAESFGIFAAV